jgi:high-affinity Fe2+/Pb2+ permease
MSSGSSPPSPRCRGSPGRCCSSNTTRYQRRTTRIAVWLSVIFGAVTTGSLAGLITPWYYKNDLAAVLGWTTGVTGATAVVIALLLYPRTR